MEFVSQRKRPHAAYGCGVACLAMLLKNTDSQKVSYAELVRRLRITEPVAEKWGDQYNDLGKGTYPADITKFLKEEGIPFVQIHNAKPVAGSSDLLLQLIQFAPVMVGVFGGAWDWCGDEGHWVVLSRRIGANLECLDPWCLPGDPGAVATISEERFFESWDGFAIQVLPEH